ncbi:MAG: HIT domain-containing protein [Deltaproteobacteria bacterium]|nr:HIT domain-containing protein [Deltaproteobacteria bacterium]
MKNLWAPWRMEYVDTVREPKPSCIFCDAAIGKSNDGLTLYAGKSSVVILNKFPYNNAHLLVAPSRHEANMENLSDAESIDIWRLIRHSVKAIKELYKPDAFNVGFNLGFAAGAGIAEHLHCHVVPRWHGDTNFMPVLSETKVLPEHLESSKKKLQPLFSSIE